MQDKVRKLLREKGLVEASAAPLGNGLGEQIRYTSGEILVIYKTGKIVVQGKNSDQTRSYLAEAGLTFGRFIYAGNCQEESFCRLRT